MVKYIIFTKTPINLSKTYFANERRGEKAYCVESKEEMFSQLEALKNEGKQILRVLTAMGNHVNI